VKIWEYTIRRLFIMIFVLVGVTLLVFLLSFLISNPMYLYAGSKTTPQQLQAIRIHYGLDQPVYIQYFKYVQNLIQGDWGQSVRLSAPVLTAITQRFPYTVELALSATLLTIIVGVPLGIVSALRNNRAPDHVSRIFALVGVSLPVFWLGLLLKIFFFYDFKTYGLPYLPVGGAYDTLSALTYPLGVMTGRYTGLPIIDTALHGNYIMFWDSLTHLVLPTVTLAFISIGVITRLMRSSMLEVLRQDYIILARSKGLSERVVIYRHALKNALIPTVTVSGLLFAGLLGGAPITEYIFQWPGVGNMAVAAIQSNDIALIMGFVLLTAIIIVVANLAVDILYAFLDPRVKY